MGGVSDADNALQSVNDGNILSASETPPTDTFSYNFRCAVVVQDSAIVHFMNCPTCKKQFDQEKTVAMPFCSDRCKTIDLGRWLDEENGLPHLPDPDDDEPEGGY